MAAAARRSTNRQDVVVGAVQVIFRVMVVEIAVELRLKVACGLCTQTRIVFDNCHNIYSGVHQFLFIFLYFLNIFSLAGDTDSFT